MTAASAVNAMALSMEIACPRTAREVRAMRWIMRLLRRGPRHERAALAAVWMQNIVYATRRRIESL